MRKHESKLHNSAQACRSLPRRRRRFVAVKTDVVTKESLYVAQEPLFSQDAALTPRFLRVYELAGLVTDFYYAILHA